jgi:hypothetical protein
MHYVYPEYMLGAPGEIRLVTLLLDGWNLRQATSAALPDSAIPP